MLGCGMQPDKKRAEEVQDQDSTDAQQGGSMPEADQGQGKPQLQQGEAKSGAQPLKKGDIDAAQQDGQASRVGEKQAATDVSSDAKTAEIGGRQRSGDTDESRHRPGAAEDSGERQQDGAASAAADKQKVEGGGNTGGVGEGIWVIDLTVDDPAALKDGEDTYMVCPFALESLRTCLARMHWRAHTEQGKAWDEDPRSPCPNMQVQFNWLLQSGWASHPLQVQMWKGLDRQRKQR